MTLLLAGVLLILGGGAIALLPVRRAQVTDGLFRLLVLAGGVSAAIPALDTLASGRTIGGTLPSTLPGGSWAFGLDRLSAWFVVLLAIVGAATTLYGVTYLAVERPHRNVGAAHAMFALLLAAMLGVFSASGAVSFLVTWEVMALSAYALIVFEHEQRAVRRAGMIYLFLTHAGTLGLVAMFLLWGHGISGLAFTQLTPLSARAVAGGGPILVLAFFGFAAKAGAFPLHFWLPGAHAAAPSHVSALLSGVMIKTGIYGLLRVLVLFGAAPAWWGWGVLLLGLVSAVLGVLLALSETDIKRALAYSSVDNIGIMLLGIGLGALGTTYGHPAIALLGFSAALLHAMNHAAFKSLLFLGSGVVVRAGGTRDVNRLGGLLRVIPRTTFAFILGSLAIIGLPPLNGFVSEWTLVRGFLAAGMVPGPIRVTALAAAAVALIAGLTLICFTRLSGTVFVGKPRAPLPPSGTDAHGGLALGLGVVGLACIVMGVAPALVLSPALSIASSVAGVAADPVVVAANMAAARSLPLLAAGLGGLLLAVALVRVSRRRYRVPAIQPTWACSFAPTTTRMQYSGASFGEPARLAFLQRSGMPAADPGGASDARPEAAARIWGRVTQLALRLRPLQQRPVTTYLQYIIGTVIAMLAFLFYAGSGAGP